MRKNSIIVFLTAVVLFCFSARGSGQVIVSQSLLNQAGMETVWQSSLATGKNEEVKDIWLSSDRLFVLTDINYLFCLDRNSGELIVSLPAARPGLPVMEPVISGDTAYIIAGNDLLALDIAGGVKLYEQRIDFVVAGAPAVNNSFFYMPSIDKKLNAVGIENKRTVFKVSADDDSAITSVYADNSRVVFSTKGGGVISMRTDRPKKLWQFDAVMGITADITLTDDAVFAASEDTNVYKIDIGTGRKLWEFHSGAGLETSPMVTGTMVYQFAVSKGVYGISAQTGQKIWQLKEGIDLLAEKGSLAYVIDKTGACSVMDNKTGKKVRSINFGQVRHSAANTYDDKIYIMDGAGNISCIKPGK